MLKNDPTTHMCKDTDAEVKMIREFVSTSIFDRQWAELNLTDEDRCELEIRLLESPEAGDVIQGTNGLRKLRIPLNGKGTRSGGRVIYVDLFQYEKLYLLCVYRKNAKDDLSTEEKRAFNKICKQLKEIVEAAKSKKD